jgi:hypothetical protein
MDRDLLGTTITCFYGSLPTELADLPRGSQPGKARCSPAGDRLSDPPRLRARVANQGRTAPPE